jgi:hypothetical protein
MANLLTHSSAAHSDISKYALWGLCLWLWATDVGPDPKRTPDVSVSVEQKSRSKRSPLPTISSKPLKPRSPVPGRVDAGLDIEAFRISFRRQASLQLIPCLKEWIPPPAQVLVKGTLERRGFLRDVMSLDPQMSLPSCAEQAIGAMNLSPVAQGMNVDSTTVQWRIDW